jgi:hypothetical protein
MPDAYSAMVRSLENLRSLPRLKMAFQAQATDNRSAHWKSPGIVREEGDVSLPQTDRWLRRICVS